MPTRWPVGPGGRHSHPHAGSTRLQAVLQTLKATADPLATAAAEPGRPRWRGRPGASSASACLALLHFAAPGPSLFAAALDQLLEPLEIPAHLRPHNPKQIAGNTFEARLTLDVHLDVDTRLRVTDRLEGDGAVVLDLAVDRPPGDLLVRPLLGDLGRPLSG